VKRQDGEERHRIFMKVKEKLDEEIREMQNRRELAIASKVAVSETLDATMLRIA